MSDLSSVMFYRTKFSVAHISENEDLLWAIVWHVRCWITRKCNKKTLNISKDARDWTDIKFGGRLSTDDAKSVYIESEYFMPADGEVYWACKITEKYTPEPGYAPREWTTEIGFEQKQQGEALFSCVVSYADRAGFVGPYMAPTPPSVPNLIRNIMNDDKIRAFFGFDDITNLPRELHVGDWPAFRERIESNDRKLPYVYISPCDELDEKGIPINLINPASLAKLLFGNAVVYYSKDLGFSEEVRYMAPELSCFGGALRVYQPGVNDANKHRYLNASYITELGPENVCSFLRRAFCQNTNFYDAPFFRLDLCKRKKADFLRKKRLAELHETHRAELSEVEQTTLDLAAEEEEKRLLAEARVEELEDEVDTLNRKIYSLQFQVDNFSNAAEENIALRKALDARFSVKTLPETATDVLEYFENTFADRILIAPEAKKSLKYCEIPADELWESLYALATTMRDLYESGDGDIYSEFREKTGIKAKRGEGMQTRKDKALMRQFEIVVNKETINIEAHITFPNYRQSIHFGYSANQKLVIIGHCGEHLKIYSTQKVH